MLLLIGPLCWHKKAKEGSKEGNIYLVYENVKCRISAHLNFKLYETRVIFPERLQAKMMAEKKNCSGNFEFDIIYNVHVTKPGFVLSFGCVRDLSLYAANDITLLNHVSSLHSNVLLY